MHAHAHSDIRHTCDVAHSELVACGVAKSSTQRAYGSLRQRRQSSGGMSMRS